MGPRFGGYENSTAIEPVDLAFLENKKKYSFIYALWWNG